MKIKLIILILFIGMSVLFAQSINTQGVLRNANGYALDDDNYELTFRIYDAVTGGTVKWTGNYPSVAVTNGVFNATLGDADNPVNMLDGSGSYWMSIEVGSDSEMEPRLKLNTSAYEMAYLSGSENVFPGAGNVGIGTTNPSEKLHIGGGNIQIDTGYDTYGTTDAKLSFNTRMSGSAAWRTGGILQHGGDLQFHTDNWNDWTTPPKMTITQSGNVGIGTTNPRMPFQINSTDVDFYNWTGYPGNIDLFIPTDFDYNWSDMSGSSTHAANAFFSSNSDPSSGTDIAGAIGFGSKNSYGGYHVMYSRIGGQRLGNFYGGLQFQTMHNNNDGQLRTDMVIKNGLVGIGTDSPSEKLHVSGNVMMGNDGMLSMYNIASGYGSETLALQTTIDGRTVSDGLPYGDEYRYILALQPEYGYVGIGTATPTKLLTIDANGHSNPIRIEGSNASNAEANTELDNAPPETLLFGGIYTSNIYFYWKDHLGNKYMTTVAGSSLNGRSDMGEEPEDPTTVQLNEQAERIATLEAELAEIKALLKSK